MFVNQFSAQQINFSAHTIINLEGEPIHQDGRIDS